MKNNQSDQHYDVIIIGAGATGAGTARDCAMRGLKVLLVERFDFTAGATGRNHGLLHSGARYAVTDRESAAECIRENMILRKIARHCVEETGGIFVTLPDDDLAYQATFVEACRNAGIEAEIIDPAEARRIEPAVNPDIIGAVKVPDGAVDPFRLTTANAIAAQRNGAHILTYHEVTALNISHQRVCGVTLRDQRTGGSRRVDADLVINAAGIWGHGICRLAGVDVNMFPAKGALLIFGHRVNNIVINRCRKPADADILVPGDTISLIGTTSSRIPYDQVDNMEVTPEEVDILLREGSRIAPSLATTRILRAYAGVRPLVASDDDPSGRSISRGIVCLDHALRDGLEGFITITGGKLMTYRLMAEWATDMACRKLGRSEKCRTATTPLPGSDKSDKDAPVSHGKRHIIELTTDHKAALGRHGSMTPDIGLDTNNDALVCECEEVSVGEIRYAVRKLHANNLVNLRRRTRLGMGTCQGCLCASRAAAILGDELNDRPHALRDLCNFLNERWKGMFPVAWGQTLVEAQFSSWLYKGVCGLDPQLIPSGQGHTTETPTHPVANPGNPDRKNSEQ
ncbi:MAG: anaerobic glycerol-3-phosphate dehydrogenase subunit A [Paramuribaculum sp.]|nr:anaerobic glycerol-3-phosphate dehydrogenase subunit A [Paramuribaculum sp.]MDE6323842.1 anaerobic glycerol-3-phosphate dehydrogenase subunit A [Paramuribaculum sp.]MDE6489339.1 anaerobic glycerol-3-phosphate dehydrogenase subunit A [Paramuribaculum sp.]